MIKANRCAIFTGEDGSMGLRNGRAYIIEVKSYTQNKWPYIVQWVDPNTNDTNWCPYSSESALHKNWKFVKREDINTMAPNEYQTEVMRTASGMDYSTAQPLMNAALGISGEGGEVADLDKEHLAKELGDVLWYIALGAHSIGYDLETIMQMNVDKLRKRYPDGFDSSRSTHRAKNDI